MKCRLAVYAEPAWRQQIASACACHVGLGPATLVVYDVSTLYFETDAGTFEKNKPDTLRMMPMIRRPQALHDLADVEVVFDGEMLSANSTPTSPCSSHQQPAAPSPRSESD